jgi:hypothetical protein
MRMEVLRKPRREASAGLRGGCHLSACLTKAKLSLPTMFKRTGAPIVYLQDIKHKLEQGEK